MISKATSEAPKQIPAQLNRYEKGLDSLDKAVSDLHESLVIVMSQPKSTVGDDKGTEPPTCPLANKLFGLNNKLYSLFGEIDFIIDSLEV